MQHLYRSLMFVPANNTHLLDNASVKFNPDVFLFDVEDSVPPSEKQTARENIVKYVQEGKFDGKSIFPRINDRESGELLHDLLQLTIPGIEGFMYPKSTNGKDVYFIDKLLETIEYDKNIPIGTFKIIPLIETTGAIVNLKEICTASPRVVAIAFGCEDYVTDLHGEHDLGSQSIFAARSLIAITARACDVLPIDTVHVRVHDLEDLEKNCALGRAMGFEGMLALNPKELPIIHKYYTPSEEEYMEAKEMVRLQDEALAEGKGVAMMNGKFIGPPFLKRAKQIIEKHELVRED